MFLERTEVSSVVVCFFFVLEEGSPCLLSNGKNFELLSYSYLHTLLSLFVIIFKCIRMVLRSRVPRPSFCSIFMCQSIRKEVF